MVPALCLIGDVREDCNSMQGTTRCQGEGPLKVQITQFGFGRGAYALGQLACVQRNQSRYVAR